MLWILVFVGFLLTVSVTSAAEWAGGDAIMQDKVHELTGGDYVPWFNPIWEPPSGEIETFLFALQAAIGSLVIGYFLGYYKGRKGAIEEAKKV